MSKANRSPEKKNEPDLSTAPFLFPDPLYNLNLISGATFLYFDDPIVTTIPSTVVTPQSFELVKLVQARRPDWADMLFFLIETWHTQQQQFDFTLSALKALREQGALATIWLSYPAGQEPLKRAAELVEFMGLSNQDCQRVIDPWTASSELIRHVFLEAFLEHDKNLDSLYDYCGTLLRETSRETLLACGYLLRLRLLEKVGGAGRRVLLSNENTVEILTKLPTENTSEDRTVFNRDVIAWEMFRQILSPRMDPLDTTTVSLIAQLRENRQSEIRRLRNKCVMLALEASEPEGLVNLSDNVATIVKAKVEDEISELFQLNKRALENFFTELFSDQTTWMGFFTTVSGLVSGNQLFTAAGAIAAVSSVTAKVFSQAAQKHQKIRQSDYALVYSIVKRERRPTERR